MYCPQCEGEYRAGIRRCPTCEVDLVEDLSERPAAPPPDMPARLASAMVDLMGFVDEAEARDARTRLKAANVACELVVRDAFGPKGGDEYWIRVPATSAAEAASTLGASGGFTTEELTGTAHLSEDRCPSCGASLDPDEDCPRCAPR
jgi:hypothetical protein